MGLSVDLFSAVRAFCAVLVFRVEQGLPAVGAAVQKRLEAHGQPDTHNAEDHEKGVHLGRHGDHERKKRDQAKDTEAVAKDIDSFQTHGSIPPGNKSEVSISQTNRKIKSQEQRKVAPGENVGIDLSYRSVTRQVLSAHMSLTSVFGMGTGGPSDQSTPTYSLFCPPPTSGWLVTRAGIEPTFAA